MKKLIFLFFSVFTLCSFQQDSTIEKVLKEINNRFQNMEVSLVHWPDELQPKLGKLKETAFMATPKTRTKEQLPLLISLHGAGGKTWSIAEQLKRSAEVKGLSLVELAGKELILLEPNSYDIWDPNTLNVMLDYVLKTHPEIDINHIYLMGHSMGGKGTWEWLQNNPDRFKAAAPCGFSGITENAKIDNLINLPIWGMVGEQDTKNIGSVKTMTRLLQQAGNKNIRFTAFPNADHAKGNAMVFGAVEWIDWMLKF
jgi:predicted peptidase